MLERLGGSASTLPLFAVSGTPRGKHFSMQDLPQTRSDALMAARTGHLTVLRELAPYIWPAGRPDLRMRVVMALVALIIAKAITLMVPIAYKAVVDLLTDEATG